MMNIVEQERACFDKEEQEQGQEEEEGEGEEEEIIMTTTTGKLPLPNSPNSSSSSTKYINFLPQHHNLWLSPSDHHSQQDFKPQEPSVSSFDRKLDLMDLSLGNDDSNTSSYGGTSSGSTEREHMFDKVVTPSDVGKLNRLVIPKQHAEKYFPLDSTANEKGLLLNFEDRNGKPWRFRYSYWNSSQSYVMTKGWSRFVKEKKLDAGDIVSFERGVGESGKHRLYIDWKRRSGAPDPTSFAHLELQNQLNMPQSLRWGKLYSLPHQPMSSMPRVPYQHSQIHYFNYHNVQPYHHNHYHHRHNQSFAHTPAAPQYYLTPPQLAPPQGVVQIGGASQQQLQQRRVDHQGSMVFDSVPVVHGRSVGKRLRLFGVNMECATSDDRYSCSSDNTVPSQGGSTILNSMSPRIASQSRSPNSASAPFSTSRPPADHHHHEFSKKGKASLSFDLGL